MIKYLSKSVSKLGILSIAVCVTGCVSPPSPGNNATYRKMQHQQIEVPKPKSKPRYIQQQSLNKLKTKKGA